MPNEAQIKLVCFDDVVEANERFNYFRNGFLKAIRVVSGNEFLPDMSWDAPRPVVPMLQSPESTGLCLMNTVSVELEIHHYNYDQPRQPRRRAVLVRAVEAEVSECLLAFVGRDIFELVFDKTFRGIDCILTCHEKNVGPVRTMANGMTTILFTAHEIEMTESEWAAPKGEWSCGRDS